MSAELLDMSVSTAVKRMTEIFRELPRELKEITAGIATQLLAEIALRVESPGSRKLAAVCLEHDEWCLSALLVNTARSLDDVVNMARTVWTLRNMACGLLLTALLLAARGMA